MVIPVKLEKLDQSVKLEKLEKPENRVQLVARDLMEKLV